MSTALAENHSDEKSTGSDHGAFLDAIDLLSYHEQQAGRLVVDPEYVPEKSSCSRHLLTQLIGRLGLSLGMPLHRSSS